MVACKQADSTTEASVTNADENTVVEIPEDFPDFYNKFHLDAQFQIDHISFPLEEKNDSTKWEKEDWVIHQPFDDQSGEFQRDFTNFGGMITETIKEKNGLFYIVRRYTKLAGEWTLIYYVTGTKLDNFKEVDQ